ncbi:hypothetical protein G3M48_002834 [Beauveria asiatica]|uniref:Uncharacterized protein n=1 Tax=Beauveria asiatica TaxID=1069075 RepID=A0AAW0S8G2_9HYPO
MSVDPTVDEDTSTEPSQTSTSTSSTRSPFSSPSSSSSSSTSSTSTSSPLSSTTSLMRDSGVTHTIPNDSTVTVTRHTTITQELPTTTAVDSAAPSTTDVAQEPGISSSFGTPSPTNTPTFTANPQQPTGGVNTGAVVGIAVGGAFAAALVAVLLWLWRSRRNRVAEEVEDGSEPMFVDKSRLHDSIFGRRPTSASLPRHPTPHQATGRGYGYDPFAPFGGRADQPTGTKPPLPPDTFEMDGRGIQVVELPGTAMTTDDGDAVEMRRQDTRSVGAVKYRPSSDPRATLNHLPRDNGQPTYINQWNQYKTLARDSLNRL